MFTGKDIRTKRESIGLSAPKLAALLNTTKENIYKWEDGTIPRSPKDRANIENWLKGDTFPKIVKDTPTNGVDWQKKYEDLKEKHYDLLEKYTALLEKK